MKKLVSVLLAALSICGVMQGAAVTYVLNGGRFGDQLITYCHARWIAYKYNLPLLYVPIDNGDKLRLGTMHKYKQTKFTQKVLFPEKGRKANLDSIIKPNQNILYVVRFFPESKDEITRLGYWHFDVDWNDEKFLSIIRNELTPLIAAQKMSLPTDRITVAVHMRRGGGFKHDKLFQEVTVRDPKIVYADEVSPLKFPPFEYYAEQIKRVSQMLNDRPIYVHIFTDDANPAALLKKCKEVVNKPNIVFGSRESDNRHDANVLDDFYALTQFDCLIRGESNFSVMASKLADYKIQIAPAAFRWAGHKLIITDVVIS